MLKTVKNFLAFLPLYDKVNLPEAKTTCRYDREFFLTYESLPRGVSSQRNDYRMLVAVLPTWLYIMLPKYTISYN